MVDLETKRTIGEILKDQSQTKDMILYDLLIDGAINTEGNTEKQKNEIQELNQSTIETKPVFKKGCKRDDCRFNKNGFCTSNAVNGNSLRCDATTNYMSFEERG